VLGEPAGGEQLPDVRRDLLADAGQLGQLVGGPQLGDGPRQQVHHLRGLAVRPDLERVAARQLQEVRDLGQHAGDFSAFSIAPPGVGHAAEEPERAVATISTIPVRRDGLDEQDGVPRAFTRIRTSGVL